MATSPSRFENTLALITGTTRGIGAAIARRFAGEGAAVVVCGRTSDQGEEVVATIRNNGHETIFRETDVRNPDAIKALVESTIGRYGHPDVLVNNVAVQTETDLQEASNADWNRVMETDFWSYWLFTKHAAEAMAEGCIVYISSNHAFATMPSHFPNDAVKAGINGMTQAFALDLGPEIRVNTMTPGWIDVERTTDNLSEANREHPASMHPVGGIGNPKDDAGVAPFLASPDAGFITGSSITVDGGRTAVLQDDTLPDYRITSG